jgi:uncharacterized membrane protein
MEKERSMSISPRTDSIVAILNAHTEVQAIVQDLQKTGFDMKKLSIVAKDYHAEEHVVGYYNTNGKVRYWGDLDAFWGGFWGLLVGSAFLLVPGIGPIVVVGPLVSWIVAALEGAGVWGGLSAVGAALYSLGIPRDRILTYESSLRANKFLVIAYGTTEEINRTCDILQGTKWGEAEVHRGGTPQVKLQMARL